jgi:flagellar protein FlbD
MIKVTRLSGECLTLNSDLIEKVEATPDSVIALTNGSNFVVKESVDEIVELVISFKARVLRTVTKLELAEDGGQPNLHLLSHPNGEV